MNPATREALGFVQGPELAKTARPAAPPRPYLGHLYTACALEGVRGRAVLAIASDRAGRVRLPLTEVPGPVTSPVAAAMAVLEALELLEARRVPARADIWTNQLNLVMTDDDARWFYDKSRHYSVEPGSCGDLKRRIWTECDRTGSVLRWCRREEQPLMQLARDEAVAHAATWRLVG